jgi:hypothetical protein
LRERGRQWIWETINRIGAEINHALVTSGNAEPLLIGRQDWQFTVETSVMVGERVGLRYRSRTLVIETGWPRLAEHGFAPDGGLARGRIGYSRNTMLDAQTIAEMVYKRVRDNLPAWYLLKNKNPGDQVTELSLRSYVELIMSEESGEGPDAGNWG